MLLDILILPREQRAAAIAAQNYYALRLSVRRGNIDLIKNFMQYVLPEDRVQAISACDYDIVKFSCLSKLEIFKYLTELVPRDVVERGVAIFDYTSLMWASKYGSRELLEEAMRYVPADRIGQAISARRYAVLKNVIKRWPDISLFTHLTSLIPGGISTVLSTEASSLINFAAKSGNAYMFMYLMSFVQDYETVFAEDNYSILSSAALGGSLSIFRHIVNLLSFSQAKQIIFDHNYAEVAYAASSGDRSLLIYVMSLIPEDSRVAAVSASGYRALRKAAFSGKMNVFLYIMDLLPEQSRRAAVAAIRYEAVRAAVTSGNFHILEYIKKLIPGKMREAVIAAGKNNYDAAKLAFQSRSPLILKLILSLLPNEDALKIVLTPYAQMWVVANPLIVPVALAFAHRPLSQQLAIIKELSSPSVIAMAKALCGPEPHADEDIIKALNKAQALMQYFKNDAPHHAIEVLESSDIEVLTKMHSVLPLYTTLSAWPSLTPLDESVRLIKIFTYLKARRPLQPYFLPYAQVHAPLEVKEGVETLLRLAEMVCAEGVKAYSEGQKHAQEFNSEEAKAAFQRAYISFIQAAKVRHASQYYGNYGAYAWGRSLAAAEAHAPFIEAATVAEGRAVIATQQAHALMLELAAAKASEAFIGLEANALLASAEVVRISAIKEFGLLIVNVSMMGLLLALAAARFLVEGVREALVGVTSVVTLVASFIFFRGGLEPKIVILRLRDAIRAKSEAEIVARQAAETKIGEVATTLALAIAGEIAQVALINEIELAKQRIPALQESVALVEAMVAERRALIIRPAISDSATVGSSEAVSDSATVGSSEAVASMAELAPASTSVALHYEVHGEEPSSNAYTLAQVLERTDQVVGSGFGIAVIIAPTNWAIIRNAGTRLAIVVITRLPRQGGPAILHASAAMLEVVENGKRVLTWMDQMPIGLTGLPNSVSTRVLPWKTYSSCGPNVVAALGEASHVALHHVPRLLPSLGGALSMTASSAESQAESYYPSTPQLGGLQSLDLHTFFRVYRSLKTGPSLTWADKVSKVIRILQIVKSWKAVKGQPIDLTLLLSALNGDDHASRTFSFLIHPDKQQGEASKRSCEEILKQFNNLKDPDIAGFPTASVPSAQLTLARISHLSRGMMVGSSLVRAVVAPTLDNVQVAATRLLHFMAGVHVGFMAVTTFHIGYTAGITSALFYVATGSAIAFAMKAAIISIPSGALVISASLAAYVFSHACIEVVQTVNYLWSDQGKIDSRAAYTALSAQMSDVYRSTLKMLDPIMSSETQLPEEETFVNSSLPTYISNDVLSACEHSCSLNFTVLIGANDSPVI